MQTEQDNSILLTGLLIVMITNFHSLHSLCRPSIAATEKGTYNYCGRSTLHVSCRVLKMTLIVIVITAGNLALVRGLRDTLTVVTWLYRQVLATQSGRSLLWLSSPVTDANTQSPRLPSATSSSHPPPFFPSAAGASALSISPVSILVRPQ